MTNTNETTKRKTLVRLLESELEKCGGYRCIAEGIYHRFDKPARRFYIKNIGEYKLLYVLQIGSKRYTNQWDDGKVTMLIQAIGDKIQSIVGVIR